MHSYGDVDGGSYRNIGIRDCAAGVAIRLTAHGIHSHEIGNIQGVVVGGLPH